MSVRLSVRAKRAILGNTQRQLMAKGPGPLMDAATARPQCGCAGEIRPVSATRSICLYTSIVLISIVTVVNPLALRFFLSLSETQIIYITAFDLFALIIVLFTIRYVRREHRRDLIAALVLLVAWPAVMVVAEFAIIALQEAYLRAARLDPAARMPVMGDSVHESDPLLGWVPRAGARARHVWKGNFDVTYVIDAAGRRAIQPNPGAQRTLHFFGDSFTFGHGVENDETALSIIAKILGQRANVTNYGVMAYGLEQMLLRLRAAKDAIQPGDVVIFSPVSLDLMRNLIAKDFVCFLHHENYSKVETFPWWDGSTWRPIRIAEHCPHGDLPLALLQRFIIARQSQQMAAVLAENADRIFRMAKAIAEERGAVFQVIFLVYPDECRNRSFDFDLALLQTEFRTLMPYCLDDRAMARMRFATDRHLTPEGQRWAAMALLEILNRTVLREDSP
jgi:hypothetical protein